MNSSTISTEAEAGGYDDVLLDEPGMLSTGREIPAWAVSLGVHLLVLLLFWMIRLSQPAEIDVTISSAIEEIDQEALAFATLEDQIGSDSDANVISPSQAASLHVAAEPPKEITEKLDEVVPTLEVPEMRYIPEPHESEFLDQFEANGVTEEAGGTEGAIDRLTWEIENSLKQRKTFVIWMFDASLSLNERRSQIADRFENVYEQLRQRDNDVQKALKTAVVSYGEKIEFLTPEPVDDVKDLVEAVRRIEPDKSGKEYVFSSINETIARWRSELTSYRSHTRSRRNVMLIIVTDERGDDYNGRDGKNLRYLEDTVRQCRRFGMKVYCVGNAAPFGRERGFVTFKDENGYVWNDCEVDLGPETVMPERLQLPFWGMASHEFDRLSSHYGPYALNRMCAETGGLYLITEHSRSRFKFDAAMMRNYTPDYRPIAQYLKELQTNRAKAALVQAAGMTMKESVPVPRTAFRADNDNVLRQQITEAQKPLAVIEHRLNELLAVLEIGEKDRPKLNEPRWRAGFDLAMGRLLAMRVRAFGYNMVLAEMKSSPRSFSNKASNQWRLVPSHEIDAYNAQVRKIARQAETYLTRVVNEHPGTPWALLAEQELGIPMGWQWREGQITIARNDGGGNNRPSVQLADDEPRKKPQPKKKPEPPRVRPKL